jgi:hypothetical protein
LVGHDVGPEALRIQGLRRLSLGGPAVNDGCAPAIAAMANLEMLHLHFTNLTDDGLSQLAGLAKLHRVSLDSHVITDAGVAHLSRLPALREFALRASRISERAINHIANMAQLTRLDMHGSGQPGSVTGEQFSIASLQRLAVLPRLHTLYLTNHRGQTGYLGLKELKHLREISLFMCGATADELGELQKALPNAVIHASNGGGTVYPPLRHLQY